MDQTVSLGSLNDDPGQRLQDLLARFEQAWRGHNGQEPAVDFTPFLPPPGDPLRPTALHALVKADLEMRWQRGRPVRLEYYLEWLPELGTARDLPPQLLVEEYRLSQLYGEPTPLATYEQRFPDQYAAFQRLVQEQPLPTATSAFPPPPENEPTEGRGPEPPAPTATSAYPPIPKAPKLPSRTGFGPDSGVLPVGGGYQLIKRIGTGGFGEVWRAEAPGGVEVAIKIIFRPLDHEDAQRELQSLEVIKRLRHPFLLQTQAYWALEDRLLIVMELADGSLRDRLKERRQAGAAGLPRAELLTCFGEAAEALDFLHSQKVLHRDIKPENLLLLQGHIKIADFGLARVQEATRRSITASGCGTPAFMAPEVWRGKFNERSDLYSLAVTYAELRLDRRLFTGDLMKVMIDQIETMPDLAPLPAAEQQVLHRALAKDPNQRYANGREFVRALERAATADGATESIPVDAAALTARISPAAGLEDDPSARLVGSPPEAAKSLSTLVTSQGSLPGLTPTQTDPAWKAQAAAPAAPPQAKAPGTRPRPRRPPPTRLLVGAGLLVLAAVFSLSLAGRWWLGPRPAEDPEIPLPPECKPVSEAGTFLVAGKPYYKRIAQVKDGTEIIFVLIPKARPTDPDTFYMMEDKVSVRLFRQFAALNPKAVTDSRWEKGGRAGNRDLNNADDLHPVLGVVVEDAWRFARWLGGDLPSDHQWNKAAGLFEEPRGEGPFQGSWDATEKTQIAVNRAEEGPLRVGQATKDISPYGIRDMAGNGQEWTHSILEIGLTTKERVPLRRSPTPDDRVLLRGRGYNWPTPLLYKDLEANTQLRSKLYTDTDAFTSFRVVLQP
jgi:serine/threonine protein kinase